MRLVTGNCRVGGLRKKARWQPMWYAHRILGVTLISLAAGCANVVTSSDSTGASSSTVNPPADTYILDFTSTKGGGLSVGTLVNFAFTVDLEHPVRKLNIKYGNLVKGPGFILSDDFAGSCEPKAVTLLEEHIQDLPPGTPAYVDHLDIEMIRLNVPPSDLIGSNDLGVFCYGYREPSGVWHWVAESSLTTYDATTDRIRSRIEVHQGPVDAIKIVPTSNWPISIISYVATVGPGTGP